MQSPPNPRSYRSSPGAIPPGTLEHDGRLNWPGIWKQHGRWLRRVLRARLPNDDLVDDVFQEVALVVSRKPERWPVADRIAPWLYQVTLQQVCLHRRKSFRKGELARVSFEHESVEPIASIAEPVAILMSRESSQRLMDAMKQLGGQDREILFLKHAENWTYDEISQHTGISKDKVIYRLGRARNRLRNILCANARQNTSSFGDK